MIFCDERKFIFFHIPKTAGSFIERKIAQQLGRHEDETQWFGDRYVKHIKPHEFFKIYPNPDRSKYTKVSVCRNPWDYALSFYSMLTQWPRFSSVEGGDCNNWGGRIHPMNDYKDFNEFIELADKKMGSPEAYERLDAPCSNPISRFLTKGEPDFSKPLPVDIFIRFEDLQSDINKVFPQIGLDPIDCNDRSDEIQKNGEPYDCSSKHEHYSEIYSVKAKEIIARRNAIDCERFDYKYEDSPLN